MNFANSTMLLPHTKNYMPIQPPVQKNMQGELTTVSSIDAIKEKNKQF